MPPLFDLGRVFATPEAVRVTTAEQRAEALARHARGDWGDVDPEDVGANDAALGEGTRLVSVYRVGEVTIWIVTEADRSMTTVLLPDEY